jgi:DNA-binding response OmpR family regulator
MPPPAARRGQVGAALLPDDRHGERSEQLRVLFWKAIELNYGDTEIGFKTMAYIVIVDDSPVNALPLGRLLKYSGHEVDCILRSGGAVEALREHPPDLLLLDIGMPDIDGIELLEQIRHDDKVRDVKVIMYSALSDPRLVERATELGAEDYLLKGGGWEELLHRIEAHLPATKGD